MSISIDQDYCLDALTNLVRINSINPELVPEGPGEVRIAEYIADELKKLGLKPQIQEKFGSFYTNKFRQFFSLVDALSRQEITHLLQELEKIDLKFKTSDLSLQILLEGFLFKYTRLRNRISKSP